jgi:hypothetical protein
MEQQMQHSRFVVLTGHLNNYPLSDLVGILRHQQKTGRLLIEYPKGPAMFYFNEGELVDAQLDNLSGLQAICVALAQPSASFNFNPLIQPPRRSIESSLQKAVSELLGCWDENGLEIETIASGKALTRPVLLAPPSPTVSDAPEIRTDQALVSSSVARGAPANSNSRPILAMAAAGLMMLGLSTVIAVTGGFGKRVSSAPLTASSPSLSGVGSARQSSGELPSTLPKIERRNDANRHDLGKGREVAVGLVQSSRQESRTPSIGKDETPRSDGSGAPSLAAKAPIPGANESETSEVTPNIDSVKVILQIENGRVVQASIGNHRSGLDAYETLALRIARQRRYSSKVAGLETVMIKVGQSDEGAPTNRQ